MEHVQKRVARQDVLAVVLLILAVGVAGVFHLDNTCYWGDDFAAYISEGIAIADGTLDHQLALNSRMHPSYLPEHIRGGQLTYVWGYPILHSLIYKIVGFDRVSFSTVMYYKIPSVICLALLSGVYYLFLRKRFSRPLALVLAAAFSGYEGFFEFMDTLYSDIVFLFFFLLSLFFVELFISESKPRPKIILGIISGAIIWYTYEVRLNGIAVLFAAVIAQSIEYIRARRFPSLRELPTELSIYAGFILLVFASMLILPSATKDSGVSAWLFKENMLYYLELIVNWFGLLIINPLFVVSSHLIKASDYNFLIDVAHNIGYLILALCIVGVMFSDKRLNLYLIVLSAVYYFSVCLLPYQQGMRYIYPLLPILLMYVGYGLIKVAQAIHIAPMFTNAKVSVGILSALLCVLAFVPIVKTDIGVMRGQSKVSVVAEVSGIYRYNIYSDSPIEVYNYISQNTPIDSKIGFFKPRALYLNTERVSLPIGVNGHSLDEVDYFLCWKQVGEEQLTPEWRSEFTQVFSNDEFTLYEKITEDGK